MSVRSGFSAAPVASAIILCLSASPAASAQLGDKPSFIVGPVLTTTYDGNTDDLLTAGLGKTGLGSSTAPIPPDPLHPTAKELRRLAIYNNYRALIDPTPGGGYGTFYGPNVDVDGNPTPSEGKIPGTEVLALTRLSSKNSNVFSIVTMMVQIPDSYQPGAGCLVTAPSSGSRGVYGAIATAGEWGLKHGCAVVYTDKGTGTGAHDLHDDTVNLLQGQRTTAAAAGSQSNFTARLSAAERAAFDAATPFRFAFKHAHSQANVEADWGMYVLQSIRFAFYALNQRFSLPGQTHAINRSNTRVIASSVSNGGGASVRAVEQDVDGLIDGLAVSEPNVNPIFDSRFTIVQGNSPPLALHSRTLIDYVTLQHLYVGCAVADPNLATAPLNLAPSPARCTSLQAAGLLSAGTPAAAQAILNDFGILPEQNFVAPSHWFAYVPQAVAVTYANAYGRFSVLENLCGYSFGATPTAGLPGPLPATNEALIFGTSNGIPPTSGVNLINNQAPGGPKEDRVSTSDQDMRGAVCLRSLALGKDPATGAPLSAAQAAQAARIAQGVVPVLANGNLRGKPAVVVTGRNDGILPPNFTSRPYYGLNQLVEGAGSKLRYIEVTNAQHLDAFNAFPGFNNTLIPLHVYYIRALDLLLAHLKNGASLPPSQVVHTVPRGGGAPPLAAANVPPIASSPAPGDLITFGGGVLRIPN